MNQQSLARIAGGLYLALAVLGGWAELGVRASVRRGGAAESAAAIAGDPGLFRLALVADVLMATVFVLLGLALHRLLRPAHAEAAVALLVMVAVGAGSILLNLTFHVGALVVATDPQYAAALGPAGSDALVGLLLDLHGHGYVLGGIFFGLWLLPVGLVALRSALFPRWLGVLLVVGVVAWLADPVLALGFPQVPAVVRTVVEVPTTVAELTLMLFLLIRGVLRPAPTSLQPVGV